MVRTLKTKVCTTSIQLSNRMMIRKDKTKVKTIVDAPPAGHSPKVRPQGIRGSLAKAQAKHLLSNNWSPSFTSKLDGRHTDRPQEGWCSELAQVTWNYFDLCPSKIAKSANQAWCWSVFLCLPASYRQRQAPAVHCTLNASFDKVGNHLLVRTPAGNDKA